MNHRQLEYVVAIVEEGSFTQAAIRCDVAQPSLSAAVARLERDLGVSLFHRLGRRVEPTDACLALLPSARDVIRSTRSVIDSVSSTTDGLTGSLDLAVQPTVIATVVRLVGEFHRRFPGVRLRVHSPADDSVAELVESGRSELGIGDVTPLRTGLRARPLWSEGYVCVDRATRRRGSATEPCNPSTLATSAFIATPSGSPTREVLDAWFAAAAIAPIVSVEVDHREALLGLVGAGCGAAIVPASVASAAGAPRLRTRPLDPPVDRRIDIVFRPGALTPSAERFLDLAVEVSSHLDPGD